MGDWTMAVGVGDGWAGWFVGTSPLVWVAVGGFAGVVLAVALLMLWFAINYYEPGSTTSFTVSHLCDYCGRVLGSGERRCGIRREGRHYCDTCCHAKATVRDNRERDLERHG